VTMPGVVGFPLAADATPVLSRDQIATAPQTPAEVTRNARLLSREGFRSCESPIPLLLLFNRK
jgi:hypothetical protein